ncbi:MAG TPA: SRPBCC family protein [Myxococcota bacterium]|jgi:hypothetical protein|nr:SRPBCC family protein [Myxococcota bacterium]
MKWVLIGVGALVLLVGVVVAVGYALPKAHVASVTAAYKQAPEAVWAVVSDFASWPSWNARIKSMSRLPDRDGHPLWSMSDGDMEMPSEVMEMTAPAGGNPGRIVTRIPPDAGLAFSGTWTWEIAPAPGGGTAVTVTESGEVYNPVFRFMARFVMGYAGTATGYLKALGTKLGENVTPAAKT